jgi:hypothetical protein
MVALPSGLAIKGTRRDSVTVSELARFPEH